MPITVSGTSIVFNDSTTQTTAFTSAVTSLNGQTGAITNTNTNSIGSYFAGCTTNNLGGNSTLTINTTVAGSTLRHRDRTAFEVLAQNNVQVNPGYSGTWRAMTQGSYINYGCGLWDGFSNLWVRIS